jgi:hypothetical protein
VVVAGSIAASLNNAGSKGDVSVMVFLRSGQGYRAAARPGREFRCPD